MAPFPTTSLLDNFNRANNDIAVGNSNWNGTPWGFIASPSILSNQVVDQTGSGSNGSWNTQFGPDCEVYLTIRVLPPFDSGNGILVCARFTNQSTTGNGYCLQVFPKASSNNFQLYKGNWNTGFTLITQATYTSLAIGSSIGLEIIGNQLKMFYKLAAGSWTQVGSTATDNTYTAAGYIGFGLLPGSAGEVDDFSGGTYVGNQALSGTDSGVGTDTGSKFTQGAPTGSEIGSLVDATSSLTVGITRTESITGTDVQGISKSPDYPDFTLELSTSYPSGAQTWNIIDDELISLTIERGRQRELDRVEAGRMEVVLRNDKRKYDPVNTASPYYPNLLPMRRIRFRAAWQSVTYYLFDGYVESYDQNVEGFSGATTTIRAVDAFEIFVRRYLKPGAPFVTTILNIANANITYTGKAGTTPARFNPFHPGYVVPQKSFGSDLSIQYHAQQGLDNRPLVMNLDDSAKQIQIFLATDNSSNNISRASDVVTAVNGSQFSYMVKAALAVGNNGNGIIGADGVSGHLGPYQLAGGYQSERSDLRIKRVLDEIGWSATDRVIDTGAQTLGATHFEVADKMTALQHMQDVTEAERGVFFVDGQNRAVFQNGSHRAGTTSQATFSDKPGAGEFPYETIVMNYDKDFIYNYVTVEREGGTPKVASDSSSITNYMQRELSLSLLVATDTACQNIANAILGRYSNPALRFDSITMKTLGVLNPMWPQVLGRELGDQITVERTPPGGGPQIVQQSIIESISITLEAPYIWETTWQLSPL